MSQKNDSIEFLEGMQMLIQRDIDNIKCLSEDAVIDYMFNKSHLLGKKLSITEFKELAGYKIEDNHKRNGN